MASADTSLSKENFSCSICLDLFNSPVSTPCGHNFCRTCITTFWDGQVQYKCPVCNELFNTRPDLKVNTLLSEMVDQFRKSEQVEEQPCVEAREVPCDICTETKLKALKSCLVCFHSYCPTHLEPHQTVARLKKHELVEPMDGLEDKMCKIHERLLKLFCQTDQAFVCEVCTVEDHKDHPVVPLKEEFELKTAQLPKMESEVQQMIQERKRKIQEFKDTVEMLNSTEKQVEDLIKELEPEIEDLTNRNSELKQLSQTEDHLNFLQTFRSLKDPPHTRVWTAVEVHLPSYVKNLMRSLDQIKLRDLNPDVKKYACELTLDPNTAHRHLSLSEDHRKVMWGKEYQSYLDQPERFDFRRQVLCREVLTGRSYWEVERRGGVAIGVTYIGITRRGKGDDSWLGGNNKSWSLNCYDGGYTAWYNGRKTAMRLPPPVSTRVGVYLDRPAGSLSFYTVSPGVGGSSDTLTLIHTFQTTFTQEDLLPGFGFESVGSSVSL